MGCLWVGGIHAAAIRVSYVTRRRISEPPFDIAGISRRVCKFHFIKRTLNMRSLNAPEEHVFMFLSACGHNSTFLTLFSE